MAIIIDTSQVDRALDKILEEFTNPAKLNSFFAKASSIIKKDVDEHFTRELGPANDKAVVSSGFKRWKGLADITKENKRAKGTLGNGILRDTYDLKNSIKKFHNPRSGGLVTDSKYARSHQFGISMKNLAARPFFWFSKKAVDKLVGLVVAKIYRAWGRIA